MRNVSIVLFSIAILLLSCSTFRAIKNGNPAIDDYNVFVQDTIHNSSKFFSFAELPQEARKHKKLHEKKLN